MSCLIRGGECEQRIDLLLRLTRITSPNKISALNDYFVEGVTSTIARTRHGLSQQSWHKGIKRINEAAMVTDTLFKLKPTINTA
ncbi:hypothetical protein HWQ46_25815 [Shewanella sp. D64]|uniref:hypothetical protein n=1 Tax=unclassified Shewanella TaxID=196818 RepID=UPI0022BA2AF8|nr:MULTISPECIES: hypothetical protein [unclassified Shewanella]MEC4728935.1 hypothetical protein [Shewanella sp. D64]MEC4740868.1 hypothetical protein [Shewanella sp. E94]WBJ96709.1 hypothetical protein HWQ47_06230 [Shewanella sp. MTB7]